MTSTTKIAVGAVLGTLAAVGIGVAIAKGSSTTTTPATPATPGVPPQGSTVWVRATMIQPGQEVRIALSPAALAAAGGLVAGVTNDLPGFEALLASPTVQQFLQAATIQAWAPGDPNLPKDWPPDDTASASEFHAQFTYGGSATLYLSTLANVGLPSTLAAWVPKGTGA